jgi:peptidoglycan hydrolase CwlO-like protein
MASIGKKILSAFVELKEEEKSAPVDSIKVTPVYTETIVKTYQPVERDDRFVQYFEKLFKDANLPGPDYFEFSKMIEAMSSVPDEKARYVAAFAGLSVQGLDKAKLLSTAADYLRVLNSDAANFGSTVDAALQEKVFLKRKETEEKAMRIEQLKSEINELHRQIDLLNTEIRENEGKIENNSGSYKRESEMMKMRIEKDIEKIKQYIN